MLMNKNQSCIEACYSCAVACDQCAAACLQEQDVKVMARCISLDLDCAAICRTAAELMSRNSGSSKELCLLCAKVCDECSVECSKHPMDHCQECGVACKRCAEECRRMAAVEPV